MKEEFLGFKDQIEDLNQVLRGKYDPIFQMDEGEFLKKLHSMGKIKELTPLDQEELKEIAPLVGVDGSTVRQGGAYPHYVEIFQGLAKSTTGEGLYSQRLYTPLLFPSSEEEGSRVRNTLLAQVELEAAIKAIEDLGPKYLIMDGGLLRYKINAGDKWDQLKELCLAEGVYICGAIKDIKTSMVSQALGYGNAFYDREVLAGRLKRGEILLVHKGDNSKKEDFSSAFYRPSKHQEVVGIDVLNEQRDHLETMARILYSLTPSQSRGVPFWIDIVDRECKLSPATLRTLLEENLDRDLLERFFISERDRRD